MVNPHRLAGEIKHHPEVEVLLGNQGQPPSGNEESLKLAKGGDGLNHQHKVLTTV